MSNKKNNQYSFERTADESGTSFLFGKNKTKQHSFEKKGSESGTAFLFNGKSHKKSFGQW